MRGNERCPCGSGLKFKKCCRGKDRPPETCHFCGRKEPEVSGKYAVLVDKDGTEQKEQIFACDACIEKRQPGSEHDASLLPMLLMASGMWRPPAKRR
jgi:hypothetical protein